MKYITKKVIKGNTYYYLQYQGYSKNLGISLPSNLKGLILSFFQSIAEKKYEELSKDIKKKFRFGNLQLLEQLHYEYICRGNELFININNDLFFKFIILFTYHSNRQEGSRVTRREIEKFAHSKMRRPKTKTDKEIMNSFEAFKYAISDKMKWNMKNIKHIHALLLDNVDPIIAGKWKNENNVAPDNQSTTDHRKVSKEIKLLILWLNKELKNKSLYPPELALRFYCKFERIHPFLDGNGRVGRILLNAILYKFKYPFCIFFTENVMEHHTAIKQALNGRWEKMFKHFLGQIAKTNQSFDLKSLQK